MRTLLHRLPILLAAVQIFPCLGAELSPAHHQAAVRKRRIMVQLDAADHRHVKVAPQEWLRYIFAYVDQPGSQIDSILLDIGLDSESAVYPSQVLPPTPDLQLQEWRKQGFEWVAALVHECHKRHIEVWWNHRFSEVDINPDGTLDMDQLHPLKAAHPDWLIRSWWWQGLWSAASPGVREMKVKILRELTENYDFDGIQIDFARHVPCLPPGRQWENRASATRFLGMLRSMLLSVEKDRNRPILLGAKVPRTPEGARMDGFDVAEWAKERLVDMLTLGSRSMDVDIEGYRRITGSSIQLTPCFDDHHASDGYRFAPVEFLRGVASNWWRQGADAVVTFNWGVAPAEWAARIGDSFAAPDTYGQAYREIGSPETMRDKDKLFAVERRGGYPWAEGYFNRNDDAPLPLDLPNDDRVSYFTIRVSGDLSAAPNRPLNAKLRLVLFRGNPKDRLEIGLNGAILSIAQQDATWKDPQIFSPKPQPNSGGEGNFVIDPKQKLLLLVYEVEPKNLQAGKNQVSIRVLNRAPYPPAADIKLEKIEIALKYR